MKLSPRLRRLESQPIVRPADLDLDRLADPVGDARVEGAPLPVRLGVCERGGATIVLTWSAAGLAREAEEGARMLAAAGAAPGMRIANTLEGGLTTPGSLLLGDAVERLGALDVPLGPVRDAKVAEAMRDLVDAIGAEVVVVDEASAPAFLDRLVASPPAALGLVLRLGMGTTRHAPFASLRWLAVPEIASFFALECALGNWHVAPSVRIEEAEERLLLSSGESETPLHRYDARLRGRRLRGPCACGRAGAALELAANGADATSN